MIAELKNEIELKIGRKVNSRGDCELISQSILEKIDVTISYNTLRRLYGLAPYSKPNINTLNILSKYVGYKNFIHFSENYYFKNRINLFQKTFWVLSKNDSRNVLKLLKDAIKVQEDFIGFFALLIRELLRKKKYKIINEIFLLKEVSFERFSYDEILNLGNSVGLIFREENVVPELLNNNTNFLRCIYLTFVDYSSINGYYGIWSYQLSKSKQINEIKVFSFAILQFRNFLNNDKVKSVSNKLIYSNEINPILRSRLLALQFLCNDNLNIEKILNDYFDTFKKLSGVTNNSFELFTSSILTKNTRIMSTIIQKIETRIKFFYQKSHLNSFYLMCAFYYKLIGAKKKATENINYFNMEDCRYSYEEYIKMFFLIYKYNDANDISEKIIIKKSYSKLQQKLKYPFFSTDFLINYFKECRF